MNLHKLVFIIVLITSSFMACTIKMPNPLMEQEYIANHLTDQHIQIPGTRLFMIPPLGFTLNSHSMSFDSEDGSKMIIKDILGGDFEKNAGGLNENVLRESGFKLLKHNAFVLNGYSARYAVVEAWGNANTLLFGFGDSSFAVMISAMYPSTDTSIENNINTSIASIVYDENAVIDPSLVAIFVTDSLVSKYQFSQFNSGSYYYTRPNKSKNLTGDLKNTVSIKQVSADNMIMSETLTQETLSSFQKNGFAFSDTIHLEYSRIDGQEAIETATFGTLKGEKHLLYTLTILNRAKNIGIIVNNLMDSSFEDNLSESKKFTHSIKFK